MYTLLSFFFTTFICIVLVSARHYEDRSLQESEQDTNSDDLNEPSHHHAAGNVKHRRKRHYYYDSPRYYHHQQPDRHYNGQEDYIPRLLDVIETLTTQITRLQQQPQPPIIYYVSQGCNCHSNASGPPAFGLPDVGGRGSFVYERNQNWGMVQEPRPFQSKEFTDDNYRDVGMPPSTEYPNNLQQNNNNNRNPQPAVTQSPIDGRPDGPMDSCRSVIPTCCIPTNNAQQQYKCFAINGCYKTFDNGKACSRESVMQVLRDLRSMYGPM